MTQYRTFENKEVANQISGLRKSKTYNETRMASIRVNMKDGKFLQKAMKSGNEKITQIDKQIEDLNERLVLIENGSLDSELKEKYGNIERDITTSGNCKIQKKLRNKSEDKTFLNKGKQRNRVERRQDRFEKFSVNNEYKNYLKKLNRVPPYILRNLKTLPNNRGYIWNGIHMYGKRPYRENDDRVMTAPQKGCTLIHIWNKDGYKVVRKNKR